MLLLLLFFFKTKSNVFVFVGCRVLFEPFRTKNRFIIAIIFGSLACDILKIIETLLFNATVQIDEGILREVLEKIGKIAVAR